MFDIGHGYAFTYDVAPYCIPFVAMILLITSCMDP